MASVSQDLSETTSPKHITQDSNETSSQPTVSRDMCPIAHSVKPQACPTFSSPKALAVVDVDGYSQAPTSGTQVTHSQQPSREFLMSLGIKVRDFAYENTLPAITPVFRVPRQVQPTPRPHKRLQRDWDDKEAQFRNSSPTKPLSGKTGSKKPRSLERKSTEPLQEPMAQHTRALGRITVKRVCSIITPPPRRTLPTTPQFSLSPPTSPLTPLLSHLDSQESKVIRAPSTLPFVVHVNEIPASRLDSESQPHPVLYTTSRSPPGCSSAPIAVEDATTSPDPRVRRQRGRETAGPTPPSNRYQLRQRPISSSTVSRCSHQTSSTPRSRPLRTRRLR